MENRRALLFIGIATLAMLVGVVCLLIAMATALVDRVLLALATTYIQIGIAGFLFAIWFAMLALFVQLRDQGIKTR